MTTQAEKLIGQKCRRKDCVGKYTHTRSHNEWWCKCDECDMFLFAYDPMSHQLRFHQDKARFKLFGGGRKSQSRRKTIQIRGNSKGIA